MKSFCSNAVFIENTEGIIFVCLHTIIFNNCLSLKKNKLSLQLLI